MHENTTTEQSLQYNSKVMGVNELPAKITRYHGLPRVTNKIGKVNSFSFSW